MKASLIFFSWTYIWIIFNIYRWSKTKPLDSKPSPPFLNFSASNYLRCWSLQVADRGFHSPLHFSWTWTSPSLIRHTVKWELYRQQLWILPVSFILKTIPARSITILGIASHLFSLYLAWSKWSPKLFIQQYIQQKSLPLQIQSSAQVLQGPSTDSMGFISPPWQRETCPSIRHISIWPWTLSKDVILWEHFWTAQL